MMRIQSLAVVCWTLVSAAGAAAECSNADFKGRYAVLAELEDLRGGPERKHPVRIAGSLEVDGEGSVLSWTDTLVVGPPELGSRVVVNRDLIRAAAAAGSVWSYEVSPDCRFRIGATIAGANGMLDVVLVGALAHGGREVVVTQTEPEFVVGSAVFKSIEPPAADELAAIRRLLGRVARRNGIVP